ncbi:MAG: hypothetical protein KDD55_06615 [Bdellovibrionales bacterium]|nr:hypothetical protein [Bdellovibrionales bacterium]
MWTLASCLLFSDRFCGLFPGFLFGTLAFSLYAAEVLRLENFSTSIVLFCALFLAVPLIGKMVGLLLDSVSFPLRDHRVLETFSILCACALFLSVEELMNFIESFLLFLSQKNVSYGSLFFAELVNLVLYCSGIIACVLCLLVVLFEFPLAWLSQKQAISGILALRALRPLVLLVLLSFSLKLSLGLVHSEFHQLSEIRYSSQEADGTN